MGSSFARNLDAFLTLKQLSQESFARAIGKSQGAVSHWLSGNREPASTTLSKICEVYGYSRDGFESYFLRQSKARGQGACHLTSFLFGTFAGTSNGTFTR